MQSFEEKLNGLAAQVFLDSDDDFLTLLKKCKADPSKEFQRANFQGVSSSSQSCVGINFASANFKDSRFNQVIFVFVDFSECDFLGAFFQDCFFICCNLTGISAPTSRFLRSGFSRVRISDADFENSSLQSCFFESKLDISEQLDHLNNAERSFVRKNDQYLSNYRHKPTLANRVNFDRCDLTDVVFDNVSLEDAQFNDAILTRANLLKTRGLDSNIVRRARSIFEAKLPFERIDVPVFDLA